MSKPDDDTPDLPPKPLPAPYDATSWLLESVRHSPWMRYAVAAVGVAAAGAISLGFYFGDYVVAVYAAVTVFAAMIALRIYAASKPETADINVSAPATVLIWAVVVAIVSIMAMGVLALAMKTLGIEFPKPAVVIPATPEAQSKSIEDEQLETAISSLIRAAKVEGLRLDKINVNVANNTVQISLKVLPEISNAELATYYLRATIDADAGKVTPVDSELTLTRDFDMPPDLVDVRRIVHDSVVDSVMARHDRRMQRIQHINDRHSQPEAIAATAISGKLTLGSEDTETNAAPADRANSPKHQLPRLDGERLRQDILTALKAARIEGFEIGQLEVVIGEGQHGFRIKFKVYKASGIPTGVIVGNEPPIGAYSAEAQLQPEPLGTKFLHSDFLPENNQLAPQDKAKIDNVVFRTAQDALRKQGIN